MLVRDAMIYLLLKSGLYAKKIFLLQIHSVCIQFIVKILDNLNKYIKSLLKKIRITLFS